MVVRRGTVGISCLVPSVWMEWVDVLEKETSCSYPGGFWQSQGKFFSVSGGVNKKHTETHFTFTFSEMGKVALYIPTSELLNKTNEQAVNTKVSFTSFEALKLNETWARIISCTTK